MYYNTTVTLRLPQATVDRLDEARGGYPRSTYIRRVLDKELTPDWIADPATSPEEKVAHFEALGPEPTTGPRHNHRYTKTGDPLRYVRATPVYRYECACGASKEE